MQNFESLISVIYYYRITLIEAGSQILVGSLLQAGGQISFVLTEAGSLIQARLLIEAGESKGEYHRANCTSPGSGSTVVHCVIRAYCVNSRTAVWRPKKKRSSNRSRVSNRSRGGSDTIVLI